MPPHLALTVTWCDDDLQEVRLSATSEDFAGQVNFYAGHDELQAFAAALKGFPTNSRDTREFRFGQEGLTGHGTASVGLRCRDSKGHLMAEIAMRSYPVDAGRPAQAAVVVVDLVPSDLDRFVDDLGRIVLRLVGERAVLTGTL